MTLYVSLSGWESALEPIGSTATEALPYLRQSPAAAVVNISSTIGSPLVKPGNVVYGLTKASLEYFTRAAAHELSVYGIRVNCVSPGYTLTPLLKSLIERKERDPTNMKGDTAMGRLVESNEIAQTVAFLASDEASAITGVNIPVDCGWLVGTSWHTYGGMRPPR